MTNQTHHTKIKMIAYNPTTRRSEEVYPEDEVSISEMTPMFMGRDQKYYTVPGCTTESVYAEWVAQNS